jgi:arylsulfatase A-like enzyme
VSAAFDWGTGRPQHQTPETNVGEKISACQFGRKEKSMSRGLRILLTTILFFMANTVFAGDRKPNVIVILADDLGYADLGFTGNKQIKTPHLDALAASGITCRNAYVSAPYCSPTRAGLLTGRYQTRFGHEFNPRPGNWDIPSPGLPTTEATFVQRLRAAGYRTGLIGKWHLGEADNQHPLARGFDEFYGFLGGENHYLASREKPLTVLRGKEKVNESEYLTDALGREGAAFIERNKGRPWFLYLAFNAVHLPQEATERDLRRVPKLEDQRRRTYLAMLAAMDDAVGTIMASLRQTGQENDTLIILLNDNGGPIAAINPNVNGSINFPFRGGKRQLLEGGLRVPFVVAWSGKLPAGKTFDGLVSSLDIAPTVLAAARVKVTAQDKYDGVNLLPFLSGKELGSPHDALFWRFGRQFAVRQGDWKLACWKDDTGTKFTTAVYNVAKDPGEKIDLTAAQGDRVRSLQAAWNEWNKGSAGRFAIRMSKQFEPSLEARSDLLARNSSRLACHLMLFMLSLVEPLSLS